MIWHSQTIDNICLELKTDLKNGLTSADATERSLTVGANLLRDQKRTPLLRRFAEQFKDFMVIILIIAAAISLITTIVSGENNWIEPIIIVAIVILNSILGIIQEYKAEAALDALKNMSSPSAKVLRDGEIKIIAATDLVPGDIIHLDAGDYIPADARVFESNSMRCDESSLTGESVPSEKIPDVSLEDIAALGDRVSMIYSGCSVTYGRGRAIVTDTGMSTEIGKIATMLENASTNETPLKAKLSQLGKILGIVALIICAIIFAIGLISGPAEGQTLAEKILELFMISISLAVAAIPEGLPAIVTVVLALGVQRMVKKNAIIKKLPAVETLGSASVICSDKTGTLTQNRMTMVKLFDGNEIIDLSSDVLSDQSLGLLRLGAMCCDGRVESRDGKLLHIGDPTETGIVAAAMKYLNLNKSELENIYPRVGEIPFDSDRKLMTTINMIDGKYFAIVKGAPDILVSKCSHVDEKAIFNANEAMASDALRVIAVAIKPLVEPPANPTIDDLECNLNFIGLFGMIDPPRPEAAEAVRVCKSAGIKIIMITGDHITTAKAIAQQLGILEEGMLCATGADLNTMSDDELYDTIENYAVLARVTPEDKIRVVNILKKRDHIVAMTGDGVNDAPALKAADIGCAMGITGTDVAKGAAAMTLTDDNFATIVTAVAEGRGIFDNIKKSIHFLLSCNLGEVLAVFFGMIIFGSSPLAAIQLLWINLISDSAPALALGFEPIEHDIMSRPPRRKNESLITKSLGINAIWQGVMFGIITLIAYYLGKYHFTNGDALYGNTMAFTVLAFSQLVHSHNLRSSHSLFKTGVHTNPYILLATLISVSMILLVVLTPLRSVFSLVALNSSEWIDVILLSLAPLIVCELVKLGSFIKTRFFKTSIIKH